MVSRISSTTAGESRKHTCCDHGMPIITRSPCTSARSSSQRGGTVNVRTTLAPSSRIRVKSRSTTSRSGNWVPCDAGANGPYDTARM